MGCMYQMKQTEDIKNELNPERDNFLIHTFTTNPNLLKSLQKIQSHFRGLITRKKIHKLLNSQILNNFPINNYSHYSEVQTDKITEDDIRQLFLKYPSLENENIAVKLKNPVQ